MLLKRDLLEFHRGTNSVTYLIMQFSNLNHEKFLSFLINFILILIKKSVLRTLVANHPIYPSESRSRHDIRTSLGTIKWLRQCGIVVYAFQDILHGRSDAVLSSARHGRNGTVAEATVKRRRDEK